MKDQNRRSTHLRRFVPEAWVRLGHVSKMGNGYLRRLLVVGATSVTRRAGTNVTRTGAWVRPLLERKPTRLVTVAIANKTARTAWALLVKGENYRAEQAT